MKVNMPRLPFLLDERARIRRLTEVRRLQRRETARLVGDLRLYPSSCSDVGRIESLKKLLDADIALAPFWVAPLVILAFVSAFVVFLLCPLDHVDVEAEDVQVSKLRFVLSDSAKIIRGTGELIRVGLSGISGAHLSDRSIDFSAAKSLEVARRAGLRGSISLGEIEVPARSAVELTRVAPHEYRISLESAASAPISIRVKNEVSFNASHEERSSRVFRSPETLRAEASDGEYVDIDLKFDDKSRIEFGNPISARGIWLTDFETSGRFTPPRTVSTLLKGTLKLKGIGNINELLGTTTKDLGRNEFRIQYNSCTIDALKMTDEGFSFNLKAAATQLASGTRSLMPTRFELIRDQYGLTTIMAVFSAIATLIYAFLRRFGYAP